MALRVVVNRTPPPLNIGSRVVLVAPARKITLAECQPAIAQLQNWGFIVELGNSIGLEDNQFAGTDEQRAADFQYWLDQPDIAAIFCARGGYGVVRLIDRLNFRQFRHHPKWIVGFSDITVLHSHIYRYGHVATLHATMPALFSSNTPESLQSLYDALIGKSIVYHIPPHPFNRQGTANAPLVGGNLSILYSLLGSPSDIDTDGKILFIEDLDEYLYHIDRMMVNLKRNGKLGRLAGLIIGGFTQMKDNTVPFGKSAYEIIAEHIAPYSYPVAFDIPAGHIADNCALILGNSVRLTVALDNVVLEME